MARKIASCIGCARAKSDARWKLKIYLFQQLSSPPYSGRLQNSLIVDARRPATFYIRAACTRLTHKRSSFETDPVASKFERAIVFDHLFASQRDPDNLAAEEADLAQNWPKNSRLKRKNPFSKGHCVCTGSSKLIYFCRVVRYLVSARECATPRYVRPRFKGCGCAARELGRE